MSNWFLTFWMLPMCAVLCATAADVLEDETVALVELLGGKVEKDVQEPDHPVVTVLLGHTDVTNDQLKRIRSLPKLRELWLQGTKITDKGMDCLQSMKSIKVL